MNNIRKILASLVAVVLVLLPLNVSAAGGIYASGGGAKTVGQTFYVSITASGATFNALEGTISVSGPVRIVSFSAGSATWMTSPSNGAHFVGMLTSPTSSLRVATIGLKGTSAGSGAVSVSSVQLANGGSIVGTGASGTSFTISRAPTPPGAIEVSSSTHPDQETQYEETTVSVNWNKPSGVTDMAWAWDDATDTTPSTSTSETTMTFEDQTVGTHYFHLRAKNADGWGTTTHFKVQIKEPDPKIDESLNSPSNIKIDKSNDYVNDIETGMVTGLVISGQTESLYNANISLTPKPEVSEDYLKTLALEKISKEDSEGIAEENTTENSDPSNATENAEIDLSQINPFSVTTDADGKFSLELDFPIPAGRYELVVQGQQEKVLTPESEKIIFEISQKEGGVINILTADDTNEPEIAPIVKGTFLQNKYTVMDYLIISLSVVLLVMIVIGVRKYIIKKRQVI